MYYKKNKYHLADKEVTYIDADISNKEITKPICSEGRVWWESVAKKHESISIIKFADITSTKEEITRLEEVNKLNIPEGFAEVVKSYVKENKFPDEPSHILKDLENKVINESNQSYFVDLDFRMSMSEMGM